MASISIQFAGTTFAINTSIPGNPTLPDYGHDLSCTTDLNPAMVEVDGITGLSQSLFRRITTPRGTLIDDQNYGLDLTSYLNDDLGPGDVGRIGANVDAEFRKDQRVLRSSTTVTLVPLSNSTSSGTMIVATIITPAAGPAFSLVVSVSAVTQVLLQPTT